VHLWIEKTRFIELLYACHRCNSLFSKSVTHGLVPKGVIRVFCYKRRYTRLGKGATPPVNCLSLFNALQFRLLERSCDRSTEGFWASPG